MARDIRMALWVGSLLPAGSDGRSLGEVAATSPLRCRVCGGPAFDCSCVTAGRRDGDLVHASGHRQRERVIVMSSAGNGSEPAAEWGLV